tara:strand:+ start:36145 stop:36498 length:354 start_codon:yes stop_codon:yes gene_type:complete
MLSFYYLKNCSTCKRIIRELDLVESENLIDIKKKGITESELDFLKSLSGSYESLFSKKSQLYKQRKLKDINLDEIDFKKLILEHYTFLKRPVLVIDDKIFIGNSPGVIKQAKSVING